MAKNRDRPEALNHLGPYSGHPPFAVFSEIAEECFVAFHDALVGDLKKGESSRQHLITRLLYISETTSVSLRLCASWALSLPAMSLVRDRYEQVVRFSWLARQQDDTELVKFLGSYYAKANKVMGNLNPTQKAELEKAGAFLDEWSTTTLTKDERAYLERWEKLSLDAMAIKRDALPSRADTKLDAETLADLYTPIYRQFSSVSHFDAYGMQLLDLQKSPQAELVLAPDPWWPAILSSYDALFSLIQCHEALIAFYEKDSTEKFVELHDRWREAVDRILIGSSEPD